MTLINFLVGVLTFGIMWVCGVANPLLWGVIAFVVNFVPILGPMVGIVIFLMASVLSLGVTWWALLPVGLYFLIHVVEGELVTPMLMARRFTINPVAVILALIFWYWMWGVPGASWRCRCWRSPRSSATICAATRVRAFSGGVISARRTA